MQMIDQAKRAASEFMQHKGYGDVEPVDIEVEEGWPQDETGGLWYFFYDLAEGTLELEVEWTGEKWSWDVMDFLHHQDKGATAASG